MSLSSSSLPKGAISGLALPQIALLGSDPTKPTAGFQIPTSTARDVWMRIMQNLNPRDLCSLAIVDRFFSRASSENDLWEPLYRAMIVNPQPMNCYKQELIRICSMIKAQTLAMEAEVMMAELDDANLADDEKVKELAKKYPFTTSFKIVRPWTSQPADAELTTDGLTSISENCRYLNRFTIRIRNGIDNLQGEDLLNFLLKYPKLKELSIMGCSQVFAQDLVDIVTQCSEVENLLIHSNELTDEVIFAILANKKIKRVALSGTGAVTDASLNAIRQSRHLTHLDLRIFSNQLSDEGMKSLLLGLQGLVHFVYGGPKSHEMTDQELLELLKKNPNLTCLKLDMASRLTINAAEILSTHCSNLCSLSLEECSEELRLAIDQKRGDQQGFQALKTFIAKIKE